MPVRTAPVGGTRVSLDRRPVLPLVVDRLYEGVVTRLRDALDEKQGVLDSVAVFSTGGEMGGGGRRGVQFVTSAVAGAISLDSAKWTVSCPEFSAVLVSWGPTSGNAASVFESVIREAAKGALVGARSGPVVAALNRFTMLHTMRVWFVVAWPHDDVSDTVIEVSGEDMTVTGVLPLVLPLDAAAARMEYGVGAAGSGSPITVQLAARAIAFHARAPCDSRAFVRIIVPPSDGAAAFLVLTDDKYARPTGVMCASE